MFTIIFTYIYRHQKLLHKKMEYSLAPIITYILISFTILISLISFPPNVVAIDSFRQTQWFEKLKFNAYLVWHNKQWHRMFTSGFIHINWIHLIINMFVLYFFGRIVEISFIHLYGSLVKGHLFFLFLYLSAIVVSSIPDLIRYKDKFYYNAVGSSGGVSAVIFSSILLYPWNKIFIFPIPIPIPAIIFGIIYLLYESYLDKNVNDNVGHKAHITGAIYGFLLPIFFEPKLFSLFLQQIFS